MPPRKSTNSAAAGARPIDALRHKDTRANIPTSELSTFVADDEAAPKSRLYPRDPSLDPQLVWRGKDEQDAAALAVPVVPIYVQEKIEPRQILDALPRISAGPGAQLDLFATFDSDEAETFEQKLDFYHHANKWSNRMILGDSLLVMASLAEKEGLKGKVQMIYLDPPYGIKFGSNWQVSTRKRDVKDGKAEDATRQPEQVRAFRDTWKLGIHSYLAYLRDRLTVARELLTETGSIFVQIGDENVHLVRCLLDEVFGAENFCGAIGYKKTGAFESLLLQRNFDYILWYAKEKAKVRFRRLFQVNEPRIEDHAFFDYVEEANSLRRPLYIEEATNVARLPKDAKLLARNPLNSEGFVQTLHYEVEFEGERFVPPANRHWTTHRAGLQRLKAANRLIIKGATLRYVRYWDDYPAADLGIVWGDTGTGGFVGDDKIYVVQTANRVIARCMLMTTDPGDLVLDPTCGSGTTAYVAEQWGRRWITLDTSRVALALARTRLMAAKYPYYLLADSPEGLKREAEVTGTLPPPLSTEGDIRKGFVYQRVPHVTLKSIANNAEIDTIHARHQPALEQARAQLNQALGTQWQEWEIPRAAGAQWPAAAAEAHRAWWEGRRTRQQQIDASIARAADTEYLYDKPYEDAKRVRVSGPFTVESLSPHRVLEIDADFDGAISPREREQRQDFATMILENLKAAGVQNTRRDERLKFTRLEPFEGSAWLHAQGDYEENGVVKRAAVSIGPEFGTVGSLQVKEAAKEAMLGAGFDLLVVCGFAFDARAGETAHEFKPVESPTHKEILAETRRQYGKLPVMLARMNPDLTMGDELLKKTGAGNLFMVFGEPDVTIAPHPEGGHVATLHGVDVYDPTTGAVRSSSTDDIACWFIDTDYDGESFCVRHAYFTGADEPYEKLQRALRAEINAEAWASLYRTVSRPFAPPAHGKIAIKVINHYGDEVMKVYTLG